MHLLASELYIYQNARCNDKNTGPSKIQLPRHMSATCFGPFSSHHQACQYKNLTKEDSKSPPPKKKIHSNDHTAVMPTHIHISWDSEERGRLTIEIIALNIHLICLDLNTLYFLNKCVRFDSYFV